jgi:hypothetical protein
MLQKKFKLTKKEIIDKEKLIKRVELEKVVLNHPQGKERFNKVVNYLDKQAK